MMITTNTPLIPDRSRPGSTTAASSIDARQDENFEKYATGGQKQKKIKLAKHEITIGTWNVRTLYAVGKMAELEYEMERYKFRPRFKCLRVFYASVTVRYILRHYYQNHAQCVCSYIFYCIDKKKQVIRVILRIHF